MTANALVQIGLYLAVLLLLMKPLGDYMALVFADGPNRVLRLGGGAERLFYRLGGVRRDEDMGWRRYALAMLAFNLAGLLAVYLLQRVQQWLPLNPQHFGAVSPDSAMDTAISFATNTNWQGYGGESTMSYLTQMLALAVRHLFRELWSAGHTQDNYLRIVIGKLRQKLGDDPAAPRWLKTEPGVGYRFLG